MKELATKMRVKLRKMLPEKAEKRLTEIKQRTIMGTKIRLTPFIQSIPLKTTKMHAKRLKKDAKTPMEEEIAAVSAETEIIIIKTIKKLKIRPNLEAKNTLNRGNLEQFRNINVTKKNKTPQSKMQKAQPRFKEPKNMNTSLPEAKPAPITVPKSRKTVFKTENFFTLNFI